MYRTEVDRETAFVISALWVVGIPIWFFVEHFFIFKRLGDPDQKRTTEAGPGAHIKSMGRRCFGAGCDLYGRISKLLLTSQ